MTTDVGKLYTLECSAVYVSVTCYQSETRLHASVFACLYVLYVFLLKFILRGFLCACGSVVYVPMSLYANLSA